mmetsp:Transcript_17066/g.59843  ORF Transcript_17066/g.59843 Transcript_17066/m.59843 type:complete len:583 (-) Transcript_17066:118-1866(-)
MSASALSFASVSSSMRPAMRSSSFVSSRCLRCVARKSSSTRLTCSCSIASVAFSSSSVFCSASMRAFSTLRSASLRSPLARATRRSSCWIWNSALYTSSCCCSDCASSLWILADRFLEAACAPLISAMRLLSSCRSANSSVDCRNMASLSARSSFSAASRSPSLPFNSSSRSCATASTSSVPRIAVSSCRFTLWKRLRATSSLSLAFSSSPLSVTFSLRFIIRSLAAFCSSFFSTSTSSRNSVSLRPAFWNSSRSRATPRSRIAILDSVSVLSSCCCFSRSTWSCRMACFSSMSALACANRSPAAAISSSRRRIASMASCHCRTSCCRSACSWRNSSAVLSSSICFACVSVTSSSSSTRRALTALVTFSICSVSSLMRDSSARVYFSSARLSSSFCRAARAHCSNSSWFQFICSLKRSRRSLPLNTWFCTMFISSCTASARVSSLLSSSRTRPASRSASCFRWSSLAISLFLASTSCCVCASSCCTFFRCSSIMRTRSSCSAVCATTSLSRASRARISASSSLLALFANIGRSPSGSYASSSSPPPSPSSPPSPPARSPPPSAATAAFRILMPSPYLATAAS